MSYIRKFRMDVEWFGHPAFKLLGKLANHIFRFALHDVVGSGNRRVMRAGDRPTHDRPPAALLGPRNQPFQRGSLHNHAAEENHVRPVEVGVLEPLDIQIHQTFLPVLGQHR